MIESTVSRRRFLVAAIAFSGVTAGTVGPAALRFASAWAQSGDASTLETLVRMARLFLPHDGLDDDVYGQAIDAALATAADDESLADVEALLNAQQADDFMNAGEGAQLSAMRAIENEASFAAVLGSVKASLYDHPAVWKVIGYEGPSYQDGGYLHRGAGEIDWLPEAD
jgi:hypothetical protein